MPRETISHMGVFEIARMMAYGITRIVRHIMSCHRISYYIRKLYKCTYKSDKTSNKITPSLSSSMC